jgi:hypothetical protein
MSLIKISAQLLLFRFSFREQEKVCIRKGLEIPVA